MISILHDISFTFHFSIFHYFPNLCVSSQSQEVEQFIQKSSVSTHTSTEDSARVLSGCVEETAHTLHQCFHYLEQNYQYTRCCTNICEFPQPTMCSSITAYFIDIPQHTGKVKIYLQVNESM